MKFKDVAHLYLGCRIMYEGEISTLESFASSGLVGDGNRDESGEGWYDISEIKPILRPLSSITEDEANHINHEIFGGLGNFFSEAVKSNEKYVIDWRISSEVVLFLIKQGFDIFGLIEADEAIPA